MMNPSCCPEIQHASCATLQELKKISNNEAADPHPNCCAASEIIMQRHYLNCFRLKNFNWMDLNGKEKLRLR